MSSTFALTNFTKNLLVDHLLRTATMPKPAALWWALFTVAPDETDGSGTEVVVAGGYARNQLDPSDTSYTATQGGITGASSGTSGASSNAALILYGSPTTNWGNAVAIGAYDNPTAGDLWLWAPLTPTVQINAGALAPVVPIGSLVFRLP
jgi:hypothetical protein